MRILVLADTHLGAGLDRLPTEVMLELGRADAVLHAGDITSPIALEEFGRRSNRFHAVLGNNDVELRSQLPIQLDLEMESVRIGMIHDSGPRDGRARRLAARFAGCDVVVFGHSHIPWNETVDGQLLFNPGSPTQRRRQPHPSYGLLELAAGRVVTSSVVALGSG